MAARKSRRRSPTARRRPAPSPPRPVRAPRSPGGAPAAGPLTGFELENSAVEAALLTGEHAGLLEDYFGPAQYAELSQLARAAASRAVRGGTPVLILPGLMGSKIGRARGRPILDDVYWFDPIDIARGRLVELRLPAGAALRSLGAILIAYLRLKLHLRQAGYDAEFHDFDWRRSITDLGADLAARLRQRGGNPAHLVGHSMGGLVARAAIAQGAPHGRLIMLGTPNFGSFAPVMAFRATHPVVRKIGALDLRHTSEQIARDVLVTFPGLAHMLPAPERWAGFDLYDLASWPADDLHPDQALLDGVAAAREGLAPGQAGFFAICGVEHDTTVGLTRDGTGGFVYQRSLQGDGTVPLDLAQLPGAEGHYYVAEGHGALPNSAVVAQAVADILDRGRTDTLPDIYTPATRGPETPVPEARLRTDPYAGRRGLALSRRELRHLLEEVAAPTARDEGAVRAVVPATAPGAAGAGFRHPFERVVVGRRRQHRVDLRLALGSITEVDARALALGVFRDVAPAGAAHALDRRLGGAITDLGHRRMFSRNVGEIFVLPTGRHPLAADLVVFVGLGAFDRLDATVLQAAAENVIRTLVNTRVEEFATVLFGGGSGLDPADALRSLLTGFFLGLCDADRDHHFRRIVLTESSPDRYVTLKEELYRLSSTPLCEMVEITFDEIVLPPGPEVPATRAPAPREQPVYLLVRQQAASGTGANRTLDVRSSLLTAGDRATVVSGLRPVRAAALEAARRAVVGERVDDFGPGGQALAELLLAGEVRTVLPRFRDHHLVVVHDAPMSRVPWETMALPSPDRQAPAPWFPAAGKGLSRRYEADNLSVAKWLAERVQDEVLRVLMVVNPTGDLPGAEDEGRKLQALFQGLPGVRLDQLWREEATRPALLSAFNSGQHDVVHYAGHAFFDEDNPERSGVVCHRHAVLSGADLAGLGNLPLLVFFNACESGRLRKVDGRVVPAGPRTPLRAPARLTDTVGMAEAFLRGGVASFIGTYWPVGDRAAATFAPLFYREILRGASINTALQAGRRAVHELPSRDWADYLFYGNPDFVLKAGAAGRGPLPAREASPPAGSRPGVTG